MLIRHRDSVHEWHVVEVRVKVHHVQWPQPTLVERPPYGESDRMIPANDDRQGSLSQNRPRCAGNVRERIGGVGRQDVGVAHISDPVLAHLALQKASAFLRVKKSGWISDEPERLLA